MLSREFPTSPVAGVGAVILDGERVLLVCRGTEPSKGYWALPGGKIELGESIREALIREVREETGLTVSPQKIFDIFDGIVRADDSRVRFHYVLIDFFCVVTGGELRHGSDAEDVRWVSRADLSGLRIVPLTLSALQRVLPGA